MRSSAVGPASGCPEHARDALHRLSRVLIDDLESLADRLTIVVLQREPSYARLGVAAPDELRGNLRANIERGLQSLGNNVPAGEDPQDTSIETGRLRARQGVPLEAVLRAYRLGGRVIWEGLLATSRERFGGRYDHALLDAASYVWRVIDSSSSALVDAYRLEEERLRRHEQNRRHAYVNALLEGHGGDPALAEEAAAALGLPSTGPIVCVVAPIESPGEEPLHAPRDALGEHGVVSSWHVRPSEMVGLVAPGDVPADALGELLGPAVCGRAGASPVVHRLADLPEAHAFAQLAARTLAAPGLAVLDDRLPEALLVSSPRLAQRLRHQAFRDLLTLPEHERDTLFTTLEALVEAGGSPTRAAERLYCHRNTVIYRLQRIESATGRKLSHPRDRLLLMLGLLARG